MKESKRQLRESEAIHRLATTGSHDPPREHWGISGLQKVGPTTEPEPQQRLP